MCEESGGEVEHRDWCLDGASIASDEDDDSKGASVDVVGVWQTDEGAESHFYGRLNSSELAVRNYSGRCRQYIRMTIV